MTRVRWPGDTVAPTPAFDLADCLIAAGTLRLGARLRTQNVGRFPMFEGLERTYR